MKKNTTRLLKKGKFVDFVLSDDETYEHLHEGDGVWAIPFINKDGVWHFGIRYEYCPPYFFKDGISKENYLTIISGGLEKEENTFYALKRELYEETGITGNAKVISLTGMIPVWKSTDYRSKLYIVIYESFKKERPPGDGTINEAKSKTLWVTYEEFLILLNIYKADMLMMFFCYMIPTILEQLKQKEFEHYETVILDK